MIKIVKRVGSGLGLPLILPTTNLGFNKIFFTEFMIFKKNFFGNHSDFFFMVYKMYVFFCFNNHSSPRLGILLLVPYNHGKQLLILFYTGCQLLTRFYPHFR